MGAQLKTNRISWLVEAVRPLAMYFRRAYRLRRRRANPPITPHPSTVSNIPDAITDAVRPLKAAGPSSFDAFWLFSGLVSR